MRPKPTGKREQSEAEKWAQIQVDTDFISAPPSRVNLEQSHKSPPMLLLILLFLSDSSFILVFAGVWWVWLSHDGCLLAFLILAPATFKSPSKSGNHGASTEVSSIFCFLTLSYLPMLYE